MKKKPYVRFFFTVSIIIGECMVHSFFHHRTLALLPARWKTACCQETGYGSIKWSFRWETETRNIRDVLVFELPEIAQTQSGVTEIAIARCISLPGTVKSTGNKLFVNHKPVAQPPLILEAYLSPDSLRTSGKSR